MGGFDEYGPTSTVWLFNNHADFALTNGPRMKYDRYLHACGIVHSDKFEGRPLLVVAGSKFYGNDKSEYWDFTVPGSQWQLCSENLPIHMYGSTMTHTANKKGLLMAYKKGVYSFHCRSSNDCRWTKESFELKISREWNVMLTVPSSLVE